MEFVNLLQTLKWEQSLGGVNEATLLKARASNGCSVVLGDRPVRLTLLRAWEALNFFGKIKLVVALAWSSLRQPSEEELKEWIESIMNDPSNDILSKSVEELGRHFPAIKKTIIEERDVYMSCKIVQTARIMGEGSSQDGFPRKLVCIVGAGHCLGMSSLLRGEIEQQGSLDAEGELRKVVETKKHRVDNDADMKMLIADVVSMEAVA
jgi:pheromone shutdown protein TraB